MSEQPVGEPESVSHGGEIQTGGEPEPGAADDNEREQVK